MFSEVIPQILFEKQASEPAYCILNAPAVYFTIFSYLFEDNCMKKPDSYPWESDPDWDDEDEDWESWEEDEEEEEE